MKFEKKHGVAGMEQMVEKSFSLSHEGHRESGAGLFTRACATANSRRAYRWEQHGEDRGGAPAAHQERDCRTS